MLAAQRARPPDDEPESADDEASDEASESDDSEEELCATTLHAAAYLDRVDDITAMVGSGDFAVDDADDTGASPLHIAAAMGNVDAARALLGLGAPVDARDAEGWTPLHEAAKTGHAAVAAALLAAGADAEALGGAGKAGALHIAAANGHTAVVAECVREVRARAARDGGGDALARLVALRDGDAGATALHHACYSGSVDALRALLGAGASARGVKSGPYTIAMYDGALRALQRFHAGEYPGTRLAVASSADTPRAVQIGRAAMRVLEVVPGVTMHDVLSDGWADEINLQIGRSKPLSSDKSRTHFPILRDLTGVPYEGMLFFDDSNWSDHCGIVERNCPGVVTQRTPRGMTEFEWEQGLKKYAQRYGG